jgi:UDPglucose--hexose-1-phosphate uridylyltransferase
MRYVNGCYESYLVLRNNRTNEIYPDGIFHPNQKLHHIKKENIGLIEVMGLAVLPKRLKEEMDLLKQVLLKKESYEKINEEPLLKHRSWAIKLMSKYKFNDDNIDEIINKEIGEVFKLVLEDCSVFKFGNKIKEMNKFINSIE